MKKTKLMALTTALLMAVQPVCAMGSTIEPNADIVEVEPRRLWGTITSGWLNPISGSGVKVRLIYNHELATNRIIDVVGVAAINIDASDVWIIKPQLTGNTTSVQVKVGYKKRGDSINTYFETYVLSAI